MAVTQLRCEPRARNIYDDARRRGHTEKEAVRMLERHLGDVVYRRVMRDLNRRLEAPDGELQAASWHRSFRATGRPRR